MTGCNLLVEHWAGIRDGIILDLKQIDPATIKTFELTRSADGTYLKVAVRCKLESPE